VSGLSGSGSDTCKSQTAFKTIGHAILLAAAGGSVVVAAGTYKENLSIAVSLNIVGARTGASMTVIDGRAGDHSSRFPHP
jgi:hypothetical protein